MQSKNALAIPAMPPKTGGQDPMKNWGRPCLQCPVMPSDAQSWPLELPACRRHGGLGAFFVVCANDMACVIEIHAAMGRILQTWTLSKFSLIYNAVITTAISMYATSAL